MHLAANNGMILASYKEGVVTMDNEKNEKRAAAVRQAVSKYDKTVDKITVRLPLGTVDRIKKCGYSSANAFAVNAILERLENEEKRRRK